MAGYPDLERMALNFNRGELTLDDTIYTAISNVSIDQPTTEGAVMGTKPFPLKRTEGNMGLGAGTATFSDEDERMAFLEKLGDSYRQKIFTTTWVMSDPDGDTNHKIACFGCRVLSNPIAHGQGDDALGGDVGFSFMYYTVNGKVPHEGLPTGG